MAIYGFNCETDKKPALLKNVYNHRWAKYQDKFGLRVDFEDLEKQLEEDTQSSVVPLMVIYRETNLSTSVEDLQKLIQLKEKYGFYIFLDFSHLDYSVLFDLSSQYTGLLDDIDYIHMEFNKLTSLTSGVLFTKNREIFKNSFVTELKEYLNTYAIKPSNNDNDFLTKEPFTAHFYNIGFGHASSAIKLLFNVFYYGSDGLQENCKKMKDLGATLEEKMRETGVFDEVKKNNHRVYGTLSEDRAQKLLEYRKKCTYEVFGI